MSFTFSHSIVIFRRLCDASSHPDDTIKESKKREEENRNKIKAEKAAKELGGLSGSAATSILERNKKMKKLLDSL